MAYKILIRKNYEKVLLHFCSLFDSEQENTLLVRWSFDSFKKVCFEAFLRSDPVYWAFKGSHKAKLLKYWKTMDTRWQIERNEVMWSFAAFYVATSHLHEFWSMQG